MGKSLYMKIVAAALVALALGALLLYSQWHPRPQKISGFIEADEIRLGSRVGGRVQKVFIEEGSGVKEGETLVELAPFDLLDQKSQAAAMAESRQADLQKLLTGFRSEEIAQAKAKRDELASHLQELIAGPRKETIDAAKARLELARADLVFAQLSFDRSKLLADQQVAAKEDLDKAIQLLDVAKANTGMRQAELAELEAGTRKEDIEVARSQLEQAEQAWQLQKNGPRKEDIDAAQAAVDAAKAALKAIQNQIDELRIVAPITGRIEALNLHPGDIIAPNSPTLSMINPGKLWVRAFLPEDFPGVSRGQEVVVTVDSYPGRRFKAHVGFIANQAEFTPSNVQTPEKRSQQVFRVKVYLDEGLDVLRPGMPADVHLGIEGAK